MDFKRCVACGVQFRRRPQVLQQSYCSAIKCQRERRRRTQLEKRKNDPDYKDNQARAQQSWSKRNSNYWREYRQNNPKYLERNRVKQRSRNKKRKAKLIAKMNAPEVKSPIPSGRYRLTPISSDGIAKMTEWTVEIQFISSTCDVPPNCKERTRKT